VRIEEQYISLKAFPDEMQRLTPAQAEDFLCCYFDPKLTWEMQTNWDKEKYDWIIVARKRKNC
jgi:hypothetical protein